MKTRIIHFLTIILGIVALSCSDKYIIEDDASFVRSNHQKISIRVGEKFQLTPMYDSEETAAIQFTWNAMDPTIASVTTGVNNIGIVEGKTAGNSVVELISTDKKLAFYVDVEVTNEPSEMRILAIGNSFSEDAVENYLYQLAREDGHNIVIGNMYIGGASLALHWENASVNNPNYQLRKIDRNGNMNRIDNMGIYQAIINENWDYISFQEVSQLSGLMEGYDEYLPQLIDYARKYATNPDVKIILHQTWAYSQDSNHEGFANYDRDQLKMYNSIVETVNTVKDKYTIDLIVPSGTAIQNGRTSYIGDKFTRDGYHLDLGVGRFTVAATWYEAIFGGILENSFRPENLLMYDTELAKQAAHDAVNEPFMITELVAYKERGPNEFILNHPLFIDFGPILSPEPYNNFKRWQDGSISGLKDEKGNNSGFILKAGVPFHEGVIERNMPNLLGFPLTASQDAFFNDGLVAPDGSSLILSNLNSDQTYSFILYATISDKGTQSEYIVKGKNEGNGVLDTDHNLSKKLIINDIEPDGNGEISIVVRKGPDATQYWGYYGLNTMVVLPGGSTYEFPENDFMLENPVLVDFGLWLSGHPFNNLKDPWDPRSDLATPVLNMIDDKGNNTGFALAITDGFSAVNDLGAWGNTLGLPDPVAVDAFWGDMWMPDGQITLSNLNKSDKYDLVFYGSHRDVGDNRETIYEVKGANSGSASLNTSNNKSEVAVVTGITPDAEGNISILTKAGPNNNTPERFYYLNTMIVGPRGFYNADPR
ncbi:MAG: DUF4886 domain-containing protein [Proteiniphilum sp.]|nr:DUF4886 domain-containing protein [Proteiniphilum sp.]